MVVTISEGHISELFLLNRRVLLVIQVSMVSYM